MDTRRYINKDKKYEPIIKNTGLRQTAMFSRELIKYIANETKGKNEESKDFITLQLLYQNLDKIKFFDDMLQYHNRTYGVFNNKEIKNPFILNKTKIAEQYTNAQNNSRIEVLAKKAQLENRFAKLCEYGRNKVIEQSARGMSKEQCARIYVNKIYKNIISSGITEEYFENCFKYYYKHELSKQEFENLETTKTCQKFIDESSESNNINMEKAYMFLLFEYMHNDLMHEKTKDTRKIIKLHAQEKEKGEETFTINVKEDGRIIGENNASVTINIPNYISPFKIHAPKSVITDEEKQNNIKLEKESGRYETNIMTLPLKLSTEQINKVNEVTRYNLFAFRNQGLYADEKRMHVVNYMIENLYKKREHQKQTILGNIKQIQQKESELKQIKEEIRQKKETAKTLKEEIQSLKGNIEKNLEDD